MSAEKPSFVLVHGAWHDRHTWDRVVPLLEAQGHRAVAVDLPGAGPHAQAPASFRNRPLDPAAFASEPSPNAGVGQEERTAAVLAAVRQAADGGKVVLVGHSMGGVTVSPVVEAAPELVHAAVYLAAFMLPPGMPAIAMIQADSMADALVPGLFMADPMAVGALRIDVASPDPAYRAGLKATFYGDVGDGDFGTALTHLHCDEPAQVAAVPSPITAARFGAVPRHYIRCTEDRAITIAGQDEMIAAVDAAMGNATARHTLAASHSPFYSQPEALAGILLDIAR